MRDYKTQTNLESVNQLISLACELECEINEFAGCLVDNYTIRNTGRIKIGNAKPRNNIIVQEYYINPWSSGLEIIMTDNDSLVDEYEERWKREADEAEEEYIRFSKAMQG